MISSVTTFALLKAIMSICKKYSSMLMILIWFKPNSMILFNEVLLHDFRMDKISIYDLLDVRLVHECLSAVAAQLYECVGLIGCLLNPFWLVSAPYHFIISTSSDIQHCHLGIPKTLMICLDTLSLFCVWFCVLLPRSFWIYQINQPSSLPSPPHPSHPKPTTNIHVLQAFLDFHLIPL